MTRVSVGRGSKQDYGTPEELLMKLPRHFGGEIVFDLAAEPHNKKHSRYFAPSEFVEEGPLGLLGGDRKGLVRVRRRKGVVIYRRTIPNLDRKAVALDSLIQDWASLTAKYGGLLWLNPPFKKVWKWAKKFMEEARRGANGLLLVPAAVGSRWFSRYVWGRADVIFLEGRLPFMGKGLPPYNKDCMLVHFHRGSAGRFMLYDWRNDVLRKARASEVC